MTLPRLLSAVLLATLLAVGTAAFAWRGPDPDRRRAGTGERPVASRVAALQVLRGWDEERAEAWREGDAARLQGLYVAGSSVGRADVALLRSYAERGLRVSGMRMQVLASTVVASESDRLVLRVTDRLAGAVAVGEAGEWTLPRDQPTTRRLTLLHSPTGWRVATVRDVAQPAR